MAQDIAADHQTHRAMNNFWLMFLIIIVSTWESDVLEDVQILKAVEDVSCSRFWWCQRVPLYQGFAIFTWERTGVYLQLSKRSSYIRTVTSETRFVTSHGQMKSAVFLRHRQYLRDSSKDLQALHSLIFRYHGTWLGGV